MLLVSLVINRECLRYLFCRALLCRGHALCVPMLYVRPSESSNRFKFFFCLCGHIITIIIMIIIIWSVCGEGSGPRIWFYFPIIRTVSGTKRWIGPGVVRVACLLLLSGLYLLLCCIYFTIVLTTHSLAHSLSVNSTSGSTQTVGVYSYIKMM